MDKLQKPTQFKYKDIREDGYLFVNYKWSKDHWVELWISPNTWKNRVKYQIGYNLKYQTTPKFHKYIKNRRDTNLNFRLANNLQSRLWAAIKTEKKSGSAIRNLGCTIDELIIHLQSKFTQEMSWENYGSVWELDHIKPLSMFDLEDSKQLLKAVHYSNLQPLTMGDNSKKSNYSLIVKELSENIFHIVPFFEVLPVS